MDSDDMNCLLNALSGLKCHQFVELGSCLILFWVWRDGLNSKKQNESLRNFTKKNTINTNFS